jgi:ABC-type bacteriocin/lantibiotic exporter with double-glycine peptidase domain
VLQFFSGREFFLRGNVTKILQQPFLSKFLFFCLLLSVLTSCITAKEIPGSSHTRKIANIPFYSQESYQCGPASLAGVLNYWGIRITPDQVARNIFSASARGTLTIDMVLFAQQKGLSAEQYRGSIENLKQNIDSGYPVVVLVDYGGVLYQMNHFMVVIGYNEYGILANSGKDNEKFIPEDDFMKSWKKTNYWTLLIRK